MDEKVIIALVAASSAVVGGLISAVLGPVIKHHLEQSAAERDRKRAQVQAWRDMVLYIERNSNGQVNVGPDIQVHQDFLTLEPYLSDEARRSIYSQNMTIIVGSSFPKQLRDLTAEISRIEKQWGLRK
ncbi:MAG: hypothetical protein WA961_13145 [Rhodanobacter sp.]